MRISKQEIEDRFKKDMTDLDFVYEKSLPLMNYLENNRCPEDMIIITSNEVRIMDLVVKGIKDDDYEEE